MGSSTLSGVVLAQFASNVSEYVPLHERYSKNRAELRSVLETLQTGPPEEKLHVVMDAEMNNKIFLQMEN